MNKKKIVLIFILGLCIIGVFLLFKKGNKNVITNEDEEQLEYNQKVNNYTITYNASNFMFELYDEYGRLIITAPDETTCIEFAQSPEFIID